MIRVAVFRYLISVANNVWKFQIWIYPLRWCTYFERKKIVFKYMTNPVAIMEMHLQYTNLILMYTLEIYTYIHISPPLFVILLHLFSSRIFVLWCMYDILGSGVVETLETAPRKSQRGPLRTSNNHLFLYFYLLLIFWFKIR